MKTIKLVLAILFSSAMASCGGGSGDSGGNGGGGGGHSHILTVTKSGTGNGTVTSLPSGINCGPTCSFTVEGNPALIASPDSGSVFTGWSSNCPANNPSGSSCTVTLDVNKTVTATFNLSGGGGDSSKLKWSYRTGNAIYYSSPAIGTDGTIYVANGLGGTTQDGAYAINPDGTLKWKYETGINMYTPALGPDGTIYVQDALSKLYAINPTGNLKWTYALNTPQARVGQTSPAIGSDGTVYIGADGLYAINPDGTLKWTTRNSQLCVGSGDLICSVDYIRTSPAIASDGTIYVGATGLFVHFLAGGHVSGYALLVALNPDGTLKWSTILESTNAIFSSPAIGVDGTIYVGAETANMGFVYALNANGTQKWRYATNGTVRSSPAIGTDGTIYIGVKAGASTSAEILALRPDGTLRWNYKVVQVHATPDDVYSSPAVGADGTIYFGAETGFVYALSPDGTLVWKYDTGSGINWSSAAIDSIGTLYIGDNNGVLSAIRSSSLGLANSPWPKFRRDNRNSGKF